MPPQAARSIAPSRSENSLETRKRLLDATIAGLVDRGYSQLSVTEICMRAGVSRGAQLHHFPTKLDLIAAALDHLYTERRAEFLREFAAVADAADPIEALLCGMWAQFSRPELKAVIELWIAARNDAALRERVMPVMLEFSAAIAGWTAELFPEAARTNPRFEAGVRLIWKIMQGAALAKIAFEDYELPMQIEDIVLCADLFRGALEPKSEPAE